MRETHTSPVEAGRKLSMEVLEVDISSLTLRDEQDFSEVPLTPISSHHSISPTPPPRHSRSSSASQAWTPPVSPSPSPTRSRSSSDLLGSSLGSMLLSASRSEPMIQLPKRGALLEVETGGYEEDLPTPRPTTLTFMDVKTAQGFPISSTSPRMKPIPSLIGPESLPYARCPSGIDAAIYVGTNLQPGDFDLSTRPASSPSTNDSHVGRVRQRVAYIDQAWDAKERYREAMAVRLEIERMKREVQGAIAMQMAFHAQQQSLRAQQASFFAMPGAVPSLGTAVLPYAGRSLPLSPLAMWPNASLTNAQLIPSPVMNPPSPRLPFPPGLPLPPGLAAFREGSPMLPMPESSSVSLITSQQQQQTVSLLHTTPPRQQVPMTGVSPAASESASLASSAQSFYSTVAEQPTRSALASKPYNPNRAVSGGQDQAKCKGKAPPKEASAVPTKDDKQSATSRKVAKSSYPPRAPKSLRA